LDFELLTKLNSRQIEDLPVPDKDFLTQNLYVYGEPGKKEIFKNYIANIIEHRAMKRTSRPR